VATDTVAFLEPDDPWFSHFSDIKHSQRYQGSYLLALERPTRFPENSRSYIKGDPVALIDWKAFARSDQLIMREQRDEASISVKIGIDISESMMWPTKDITEEHNTSGPTKWETSIRIGFNIAHQHLKNGDTVTIALSSQPQKQSIKIRRTLDLISLFEAIRENNFSHKEITSLLEDARTAEQSQKKCDVGYWLGDAISDDLSRLGFHESCKKKIFIHTLHSMEINTSWMKNPSSYFDKEASLKELPGDQIKNSHEYDSSLELWVSTVKKKTADIDCTYLPITEQTTIDDLHEMIYHSFLG